MSAILGYHETYVKRNNFVVKTAHCTRGLFLAVIAFSSSLESAELSIWVHSSGFVNVASMPLRRGGSIEFNVDAVSMIWSPWGDRICIVYASEITIVRLKFEMTTSQQEISYDDAIMYLAKLDESTFVSDMITVKVFPIKRISPKRFLLGKPMSAILSDMGRYILVGSEENVLKKLNWHGDILSEVQCPTRIEAITVCPRMTAFEHLEGLHQSIESKTNPGSSVSTMNVNRGMFMCGWSERLRISAAVITDGGFVFLRSLQVSNGF